MLQILYKHIYANNVCKQYVGLSKNNKIILLDEFLKYNNEKPTLTLKQFFDLFESEINDSKIENCLLLIDDIIETAQILKIELETLFEHATDKYFDINEFQFNEAIISIYKNNKDKVLTKRITNNYKKLFKNWFVGEMFYKTL